MSQTPEQYMSSQEMPEECPVCGGQYCDDDGTMLVPDAQAPFCTGKCQEQYMAQQRADDAGLAAAYAEQAALPSREEIREMYRSDRQTVDLTVACEGE